MLLQQVLSMIRSEHWVDKQECAFISKRLDWLSALLFWLATGGECGITNSAVPARVTQLSHQVSWWMVDSIMFKNPRKDHRVSTKSGRGWNGSNTEDAERIVALSPEEGSIPRRFWPHSNSELGLTAVACESY
jgi:hypothetical protein